MVLLIFLATLLTIVLPLGEVLRFTPGITLSITGIDVVTIVGAMIFLLFKFFKKERIMSLQAKAFIAVVGMFVLSLLLNIKHLAISQLVISSLYILRFASLTLLFFITTSLSAKEKKETLLFLTIGGTLLMLSGYIQYFFYPSLRNLIYFGWDDHFYRMFGTFFDPNFFGLFLVLFFLFILSLIFKQSFVKGRTLFITLSAILLLSFVGIFLTYSRTALIALVGGSLVLLWDKKIWRMVVLGGLLVGFVWLLYASLSHPPTATNSIFRKPSVEARLGSGKDALVIFQDSPIVGIGFNAYRYSMYKHHFQPGTGIQEDHGASGVDSSLLLVLATTGFVGLSVYLFFWGTIVRLMFKQKNRIGLATIAALFLGSFFVNGLFYPFLLVWVWILLGITGDAQSVLA